MRLYWVLVFYSFTFFLETIMFNLTCESYFISCTPADVASERHVMPKFDMRLNFTHDRIQYSFLSYAS